VAGPQIKLFATEDGVIHWTYPMAGQLTVCGRLGEAGKDGPWLNNVPTCVRCIAIVQANQEGDGVPWMNANDPTKKLG
jgi:hypothetical protein